MKQLKSLWESWQPHTEGEVIQGDMPGDKIQIQPEHEQKAALIFRQLGTMAIPYLEKESGKMVLTVCGGSGVGKSEIASLLAKYFRDLGIGAYTLSGDNYPRRMPKYNDAERLHIFRESGTKALIEEGLYTEEVRTVLKKAQMEGIDADWELATNHPFMKKYIEGGVQGLKGYLGTPHEIEFADLQKIVYAFKEGKTKIWLKRMGREEGELWYEEVDFTRIQVLIIEWTHGNSDYYQGVDLPILLNSTPAETLAHRKARNRDGKTDSPFTMRVLETEQALLQAQAHKAAVIVSKQGELLDYEAYKKQMEV